MTIESQGLVFVDRMRAVGLQAIKVEATGGACGLATGASKDSATTNCSRPFTPPGPSLGTVASQCGNVDFVAYLLSARFTLGPSDTPHSRDFLSDRSPQHLRTCVAARLHRPHPVAMDEKKKPTWGVTAAISEAPPSEADNKLNDELIDTLTRMNVFETPEGNKRREEVLAHVQKVVEEFVRRAGKQKGLAQSSLDVAGGKIFFFGSYALGVHGPTSDIDTLIVVPKHVYIDDFFKMFPTVFRELSDPKDITELVPVEDAFVPIIKMEYRGVSLDLLFASMPTMSSVPRDMETVDKAVLRHLEETTIRSVNGTRVVKELLASVPQRRHFRYALRAVKLWANRRGIYGAVFGYPGGIAWAIMVARICQLYPMACGATILAKFFNLMHKWNWPRPVMLKEHALPEFGLRVWNPAVSPILLLRLL
jgi:poly(A) polymerase